MFAFSPTTLILFVDRHQTPTVYGISDNIVFLITSYERSYRIAVLFTAVCLIRSVSHILVVYFAV